MTTSNSVPPLTHFSTSDSPLPPKNPPGAPKLTIPSSAISDDGSPVFYFINFERFLDCIQILQTTFVLYNLIPYLTFENLIEIRALIIVMNISNK